MLSNYTQRQIVLLFAIVLGLTYGLWRFFGQELWIAWLISINLIALLTYGYDKARSTRKKGRISEKVLLLLALAGGSLGAFVGMQIFRHKVSKASFQRQFWLAVVIQILVIAGYLWLAPRAGF